MTDGNETENLRHPATGPADSQTANTGEHHAQDTQEHVEVEQGADESVKGQLRQADYTRKMQALAEERRQIESIRQKAAMADLLLANPGLAQNRNGAQASASDQDDGEWTAEDAEAVESLEPKARRAVEAIIRKFKKDKIDREYQPIATRYIKAEDRRIKAEWESLCKEFPEAKEHQAEVVRFLQQNPSIDDLRTGLMAAVGDKIVAAREARSKRSDLLMRQNAQTVQGGTPASQTQPVAKPKFKRLADALAEATSRREGDRS